jgi:hypothetical protein
LPEGEYSVKLSQRLMISTARSAITPSPSITLSRSIPIRPSPGRNAKPMPPLPTSRPGRRRRLQRRGVHSEAPAIALVALVAVPPAAVDVVRHLEQLLLLRPLRILLEAPGQPLLATSASLRTGFVPGVATAEFDDEAACSAARVALVERFQATKMSAGPGGGLLETACLPKGSTPAAPAVSKK